METSYQAVMGRKFEGFRLWASVGKRSLDLQRKTERREKHKTKKQETKKQRESFLLI